jgi:hypothetical protein
MKSPSLWPDPARRAAAVLAVLLVAGIGFGIGYLVFDGSDDSGTSSRSIVVVDPGVVSNPDDDTEPAPDAPIGFPALATRNTTRVGGADPIADAAGVALASYPSAGGAPRAPAVVLAPSDSWQEALAATPLTADPIAAPVLLGNPDGVPTVTADALTALRPEGLADAKGAQVISVGDVAEPDDLEALEITGGDPAKLADHVDEERARLTGVDHPDHLLVVSSKDAELAMPAAAWAARSGDPILFAAGDDVPEATLDTIKRHPRVPIYVLGPDSVISAKALDELGKTGSLVNRVGSEDPVENAIDFARYSDGDFGWDVNDPGHGFAIANTDRPLDAAAAAPLSAGGKPGPLLVTDDAAAVPEALQGYLSDTQPGFVDDPSRALYNHVWLLGDPAALSVAFQAQVDTLTQLARVSSGTSGPDFGGDAEDEPGAAGGKKPAPASGKGP